MEIERPPTREALNHGTPTTPRPSAAGIVRSGETAAVLLPGEDGYDDPKPGPP